MTLRVGCPEKVLAALYLDFCLHSLQCFLIWSQYKMLTLETQLFAMRAPAYVIKDRHISML
ncbi:hypothetical protein XAC301_12310 [Xanthomonas arboricola pv. corylina]|uniref:Uncharacterized protein n=1 Tax=Xanthomonas arboricola pv. corylina TaxID=487821 RepID=A0ABM8R4Z1_9XANT|nr:hypothetical protein XAC301_12310 [Xanthomonas arboricola pv. corylina]CAE6732822.1 hypothetical protein XAC301_12310 [Xanthomonas arboricola pv. corylina]